MRLAIVSTSGEFKPRGELSQSKEQTNWVQSSDTNQMKIGSIGYPISLDSKEKKTIPIIIGWYFPKFKFWRNYYGVSWKNGIEVARYILENFKQLELETRSFQEAFFSSTLLIFPRRGAGANGLI